MIVLGIETATSVCGVGLAGDEGLIAEYRLIRKHSHAEALSDSVKMVCDSGKIALESLGGVAISNGPGSFTGLRIGLGYVKGLAFGADLNLIAVPTLEAMLWQVPPVCSWACVLLMARKGEAYRGIFQWQKNYWITDRAYDTVAEDTLFNELPDDKILFIGDGSRQFQQTLEKDARAMFINPNFDCPSGFSVASLGREKILAGESTNLDEVTPQYLKRFQGVA